MTTHAGKTRPPADAPDRRPHVLLITVDQWPGHLLGAAGHPAVDTPTLDSLARCGVRYTRAYSECPICIPARRTLMTGTTPRTHGDRVFQPALAMPGLPTLAQVFTACGYQAFAVGKLHVYPPRDRVGFDDALISEEGRQQLGGPDDHDLYLASRGFVGEAFLHGMSNNEYDWRAWHLPEDCHVTNWATRMMCTTIKRRDPKRPAFWYLSYAHPHPPLVPLQPYLDRYRDRPVAPRIAGDWALREATLPPALRGVRSYYRQLSDEQLLATKRAFYALCTHIDHQIRVVIGTLREEGLLDDTIILFTSDHGEMLGDHHLYGKRLMYEGSANVPMILVDRADGRRCRPGTEDPRLVGLQDVMPTLLDLAGIDAPDSCEGRSMVGETRRAHLYCEAMEGNHATRMACDGRFKLIWYPVSGVVQLFDLDFDRDECCDLAADAAKQGDRERLERWLVGELYGADREGIVDGRLGAIAAIPESSKPNRGLSGQRGLQFPAAPLDDDPGRVVGAA